MTLSKMAGAGSFSVSNVASPGINGLYGKKPDEKVSMPTGTNRLAITVAQLRKPAIVLYKSAQHDLGLNHGIVLNCLNCPRIQKGRIMFTIDAHMHTAFSNTSMSRFDLDVGIYYYKYIYVGRWIYGDTVVWLYGCMATFER
jgi:hypothetical protein